MQHLRTDLNRLYDQRRNLFQERWALGPNRYAKAAIELNIRIRSLEMLLCEHFPDSVPTIFWPRQLASE